MVAKQTLPEMLRFVNNGETVLYFVIFLSCLCCQGVESVQYCWRGKEDDLLNWKNQSCTTRQTSLGNLLSRQVVPGHNDDDNTTSIPPPESFDCMAFKHEDITIDGNLTSTTFTVEYSCDFEHVCSDKEMEKGINFQKDARNGILYCCNSTNNCNKHTLIQNPPHAHRCYNAFKDENTQTINVETCPSQNTYCLKVTTQDSVVDKSFRLINQSYSCDLNNVCDEKDLTDSLDKDCKIFMDSKNQLETEICCCKEDTCFTPEWTEDGTLHPVMNPGVPANSIQRTILIGIGIAIGLLVAAVAIFVVLKHRRQSKATRQLRNVNVKMVYSAVYEDDMRDDVNIIQRA